MQETLFYLHHHCESRLKLWKCRYKQGTSLLKTLQRLFIAHRIESITLRSFKMPWTKSNHVPTSIYFLLLYSFFSSYPEFLSNPCNLLSPGILRCYSSVWSLLPFPSQDTVLWVSVSVLQGRLSWLGDTPLFCIPEYPLLVSSATFITLVNVHLYS